MEESITEEMENNTIKLASFNIEGDIEMVPTVMDTMRDLGINVLALQNCTLRMIEKIQSIIRSSSLPYLVKKSDEAVRNLATLETLDVFITDQTITQIVHLPFTASLYGLTKISLKKFDLYTCCCDENRLVRRRQIAEILACVQGATKNCIFLGDFNITSWETLDISREIKDAWLNYGSEKNEYTKTFSNTKQNVRQDFILYTNSILTSYSTIEMDQETSSKKAIMVEVLQ